MEAIRNWFTPATRDKIYAAIAAIAPILVTAGVLVPAQVEPIMVIVAALLQAFAGLLALVNLRATEAYRWFATAGRAVIYSGAVAVAGAIVTLGLVTQDWATSALTYTSFGLTALAAILAVVTPKVVDVPVEEIEGELSNVQAVVVDGAIIDPHVVPPTNGTPPIV